MTAIRTISSTIAGLVLLGSALTGCSTSAPTGVPTDGASATAVAVTKAPEPAPVLTGKWKQTNSKSPDSYQAATIKGSTITINWVSDGGDTFSLYWKGSFEAPTEAGSYSWTSEGDTEKMQYSLLASQDKSKKISYSDGEISYKVSALGTTTTVRLAKK